MIRSAQPFTVACPSCAERFPVDPAKVPDGGIPAICSACLRVFRVTLPEEAVVPEALEARTEEGPPGVEGNTLSSAAQRFGRRDPHQRARHLARVLVSDIIAYHPERYQESLARRTLREDFQDEIRKSWKEYVDQVGVEMAEGTRYFDEALTDILGKGQPPS